MLALVVRDIKNKCHMGYLVQSSIDALSLQLNIESLQGFGVLCETESF